MLMIQGKLENLYTKAEFTDKLSGEITPAKLYIQLMAKLQQEDGSIKLEMMDIKADMKTYDTLMKLKDKEVTIPAVPFSPRNSQTIYFSMPKGASPNVVG